MSIRGSYNNGFAPRDAEPLYPQLWRGCVGAWAPCLGPSGITLRDWSGCGNHGTLTSMDSATDWVISDGEYALDFDGTDDIVTAAALGVSGGFTLSAWVRKTASTTNKYILAMGRAASDTPFVGLRNGQADGTKLSINMRSDTSANGEVSAGTINDGNWHHCCATSDGATAILYLDGVSIGSVAVPAGGFTLDQVGIGGLKRIAAGNFGLQQIDDCMIKATNSSPSDVKLLSLRRGIAYEMRSRRRNSFQVGGAAAIRRHLMLLGVGR